MLRLTAVAFALAATGCSPPASQTPTTESGATSAPEGAFATEPSAIGSTGTVTAIDASAGTITLNHEAIEAISWPAMSMQFEAEDPAILQGIAIGDRVSFELKSATEPQIVTAIRKQE